MTATDINWMDTVGVAVDNGVSAAGDNWVFGVTVGGDIGMATYTRQGLGEEIALKHK